MICQSCLFALAHQSRHPLGNLIKAGPGPIRAVAAEAHDACIDHPWVGRQQRVVSHIHGLDRPRFEVLDDNVDFGRQPPQLPKTLGTAKFKSEAALVAIDAQILNADAAVEGSPDAAHFAIGRRLDLDNFGPGSPRIMVLNGPATAQVKSRTRMPARGLAALSDEGIGEPLEICNDQVRLLGPVAERLLAAINECGVKAIGLGADAVEGVAGDK